ncbi:MAG: aminomethyltransferase family protein [Planctomycetota bacterium]
MLRTTPFHTRTAPLVKGQAWRRWAGHLVASSYELTHEREYFAIRQAAAVIDVSPLCKYRITGRDARRLLNRVVTRNIAKLAPGAMVYTPWCDARGKVIDDGTIARFADGSYRLTSAEPNLRWLGDSAIGLDVAIEDVSQQFGALAVQGPESRALLATLTAADLAQLRYYRFVEAEVGDVPVMISRTGYTGDLGFELWVRAERAPELWDRVCAAGSSYGLQPAGIWALDLARIEAGLIMLDVDYTPAPRALNDQQLSTPFELGLGRWVDFAKGPFTGRRALLAEDARGPAWEFTGLEIDTQELNERCAMRGLPLELPAIAWRGATPIRAGRRQVGYATSGCWSPLLKKYLALAHLDRARARVDAQLRIELLVDRQRQEIAVRRAELPFFDPERKRA